MPSAKLRTAERMSDRDDATDIHSLGWLEYEMLTDCSSRRAAARFGIEELDADLATVVQAE